MISRSLVRLVAALCVWAAAQGAAQAQFFITEAYTYTGSWTAYDAGTNAPVAQGTITTPVGVYVSTAAGGSGPFWFIESGNAAATSGSNLNFFGIYSGVTPTSAAGDYFYQDPAATTFGTNQSGTNLAGRFDPNSVGVGASSGTWESYTFDMFMNLGVGPNGAGPSTDLDPAGYPINGVGSFSGQFLNVGGDGLRYAVDLTFNYNPANPASGGPIMNAFGSNTIMPEPASCVAFAMVFAASAGYGWRRRKQRLADAANG